MILSFSGMEIISGHYRDFSDSALQSSLNCTGTLMFHNLEMQGRDTHSNSVFAYCPH